MNSTSYTSTPRFPDNAATSLEQWQLRGEKSTPRPLEMPLEPAPDTSRYTVVAGDTLWAIARAHDVELADLIEANPQIQNPHWIQVGDTVQLPVPSGVGETPKAHASADSLSQLFTAIEWPELEMPLLSHNDWVLPEPPATAVAEVNPDPPPGADRATYRVQRGDTLWAIARRFGVSLADLVAANPQIQNPDRIAVGEAIGLPGEVSPAGAQIEPAPVAEPAVALAPIAASPRNVRDLATLLMSEASVGNTQERISVGWTVLNRLMDSRDSQVSSVFRHYATNQAPTPALEDLARQLLRGEIPDPTGGADHFYSPRSMPKAGESTVGFDTAGGLEGPVAGLDQPNYRPGWAAAFDYAQIPGVREAYYKFYRSN